jgi:hypothetical protein
VSAVSIVTVDPDYNDAERIVFFAIAVLCNFGFDMLKTFLATRLKHIMTHRTMNFISKAVGCGIIYFGITACYGKRLLCDDQTNFLSSTIWPR